MAVIKSIINISPLSFHNMQIINKGEWLTDDHIEYFHKLLEANSNYKPRDTWRVQLPNTIQPVPENQDHIQILHQSDKIGTNAGGHWVCSFYKHVERRVYIYDSLNSSKLHSHHKIFLDKLYPFFNKHDGAIDEEFIEFPRVQTQPNGRDCGVFAIAFAVSLLFKILPDKVTYTHALMRQHLIKMFQSNRIEHFPSTQDQQLTRCVHEYESAIGSTINKNPSCGNDPAFKIGQRYITNETDNKISPVQNVVHSDKEVTICTKNIIQTDPHLPLVSKSKISNVYLPGSRTEYMSNYYKRQKEEINLKRKAVYKAKKGECNMKKGKDCNKRGKSISNYEYYNAHKEVIYEKRKKLL